MVLFETIQIGKSKKSSDQKNMENKVPSHNGKKNVKQMLKDVLQSGSSTNKHHRSRRKSLEYTGPVVHGTEQRVSDWIDTHFVHSTPQRRKAKSVDHADKSQKSRNRDPDLEAGGAKQHYARDFDHLADVPHVRKSRRRKSLSVIVGDVNTDAHNTAEKAPLTRDRQLTHKPVKEETDSKPFMTENTSVVRHPYRRSRSVESPRDLINYNKQKFLETIQKPTLVGKSVSVGTEQHKQQRRDSLRSYESLNSLVQNAQVCYSLLHVTQMSNITDVCSGISSPTSTLKKSKKLEMSTIDSESRQSLQQNSVEDLMADFNNSFTEKQSSDAPSNAEDVGETNGSLSTICSPDVCKVDIVVTPPQPDVCPVMVPSVKQRELYESKVQGGSGHKMPKTEEEVDRTSDNSTSTRGRKRNKKK